MTKKTSITAKASSSSEKNTAQGNTYFYKQANVPQLWLWLAAVIVVGVLIVVLVSSVATSRFKNIHFTINPTIPVPPITTFQIQRTAPYAGLDMTVISAQYATFFTNDNVHPGPAVVRLNMRIYK